MCNKNSAKKGFTLVEVFIATLVISFGVLASYIMVQQIFAYSLDNSYRLTAAYLAKEGIEIVRNIRDTGWIQNLAWASNGLGAGYYEASYSSYALTVCPACSGAASDYSNLNPLKISSDSYNYSSGTDTVYKRRIRIQRPTADSIKATVDVFWKKRGQIQSLTVEADFYDWLP